MLILASEPACWFPTMQEDAAPSHRWQRFWGPLRELSTLGSGLLRFWAAGSRAAARGKAVQYKAPAAGVIPLPWDSDGALRVSIRAFNTLFCNFCLGSNEAWQLWLVHDNNPTLVSFESFIAKFIKEEWLFQNNSKHASFYKTLWLTAWNSKVFFEL